MLGDSSVKKGGSENRYEERRGDVIRRRQSSRAEEGNIIELQYASLLTLNTFPATEILVCFVYELY